MKDFDIIIAGGGISGVMAAIAAARSGARPLVLEQYGFLGGMLTAAGVGPMMTFHAGHKQAVQGIIAELVERLKAKGRSPGHIKDTTGYTYSVTPFDAEAMKHELEIMLLESGASVLYHTMLAGVRVRDRKLEGITICNKAGLSEVTGKIFIDATGDADLSAWSGVECTKGRESDGACQPMTMNIKMKNVDIEAVKEYAKAHPEDFKGSEENCGMSFDSPRLSAAGFLKEIKEAEKSGRISFKRECILFFETNSPGEVIINTTRILGCDGTDPFSLTRAEIEGRKQVRELEALLLESIPGFEKAEIVYSGPSVGVRGSRQIKGLYTLTHHDLLSCKKFEDVIAHSGYPVDIHSPDGKGTENMHLKWGDIYGIPYRCLINDRVLNLITVGRCISATFEAQAAIRTTPTAGAIGQAGGAAAAICTKSGIMPAEVSIPELQDSLLIGGAYLEL